MSLPNLQAHCFSSCAPHSVSALATSHKAPPLSSAPGSRAYPGPPVVSSGFRKKQTNNTILQAQLLPTPYLHPLQPSVLRDLAPPVRSTSHHPHLPQPHSSMASSSSPGKQLSSLLKPGNKLHLQEHFPSLPLLWVSLTPYSWLFWVHHFC